MFSIVLKPCCENALGAFLDALRLFGMGYSWGGFVSPAVAFKPYRTATSWTAEGPCIRFHVGLENPDDLKADLGEGFKALKSAS